MDNILFFLSFLMLFYGGELLVKGSVAIALRMRISSLVVGMTVVSFATSSPELFVSIKASLNGLSDITFGNVIGSNIANLTLVLGVTSLFSPIKITKQTIIINYPVMLTVSVFFGLILFFYREINQFIGVTFVFLLSIFVWKLISLSRSENTQISIDKKKDYDHSLQFPIYLSVIYLVFGVFLLVLGSNFLVDGVSKIAQYFSVSERIISVSLVAIGTSIPELATSLVAVFRKESEMAIGNLIGSNIFNILAVLGITSIIKPLYLTDHALLLDLIWMVSTIFILGIFIYCFSKKIITRIEGLFLSILYVVFMYFLFFNI